MCEHAAHASPVGASVPGTPFREEGVLQPSMYSQVEPVGSMGDVFSDLWWGSQDQEEDLCEELSDGSVFWTAR